MRSQRLKSNFVQITIQRLHKIRALMTFLTLSGAILVINMTSIANAITYGPDGMPVSLSGDEFIIVRDTALSDPKVQKLIDGRNYIITDCCGFYKDPAISSWQPVINVRVANELQIAIRVDLDARKVTGIETGPVVQHQVPKTDSTAAEEVVKQSSTNDDMTSIPMLATNTSTVLPMILAIGIALGGAAGGIFYYAMKGKNSVPNKNKTN